MIIINDSATDVIINDVVYNLQIQDGYSVNINEIATNIDVVQDEYILEIGNFIGTSGSGTDESLVKRLIWAYGI